MLTQAARTLVAVTLTTGLTVIGIFASADASLAVPRSPAVNGMIQVSSGAYQELVLP